MKAIFEFDLPKDQHEYDLMNQASRMHRMLWEFSEQLRNWEKYGHQFTSAENAIYSIREELYRSLNEHDVDIDL